MSEMSTAGRHAASTGSAAATEPAPRASPPLCPSVSTTSSTAAGSSSTTSTRTPDSDVASSGFRGTRARISTAVSRSATVTRGATDPPPHPAVGARGRAVTLTETVEDVREQVRMNPLPGVAHPELDMRGHASQGDLDAPAGPRELNRVGDEMPHDLPQPVRVAVHHGARPLEAHVQVQALRLRAGPERIDDLGRESAQLDGAHAQA